MHSAVEITGTQLEPNSQRGEAPRLRTSEFPMFSIAELLALRPLVLASGSDRLLGVFNQLCVAALVDVERND